MSEPSRVELDLLTRRGLLGLGAGLGAGAVVGVLPAAAAPPPGPAPAPSRKVLSYSYQRQKTQSWCSAASSRIALSARGVKPTQASLAQSLGLTGGSGLQDPKAIARVLNSRLGIAKNGFRYRFHQPKAGTLKRQLRAHVVASVRNGYPVVINMNSVAGDSFSAGHYIAIVGYSPTKYLIADPYDPGRKKTWYLEDKIVAWNKLNRYTSCTG